MNTDHHDESGSKLPFDQKLITLLDHWIKHNQDHAETYRNWAEKAKAKDWGGAGALLEEAADMSLQINEKFKQALALVAGK
jgi:hypothetical protein